MEVKVITARAFRVQYLEDNPSPGATVLYGAGEFAKHVAPLLLQEDIQIDYICDRDSAKEGKCLFGAKILTPESLAKKTLKIFLVLAIDPSKYPIPSIVEDLEFKWNHSGQACGQISFFQIQEAGIHFSSIEVYQSTEHWFYPLCYDRVTNFNFEYVKDLLRSTPVAEVRNGELHFNDYETPYFHIKQGLRRTVGAGETKENKIYFLGDSRIFGTLVEDKHTIASFLQKRICNSPDLANYDVCNYGRYLYTISSYASQLQRLPLQKGDIVFFGCKLFLLVPFCMQQSLDGDAARALYLHFIQSMQELCKMAGANFYYLYIPQVDELEIASTVEQYHQLVHLHPSSGEARESIYADFRFYPITKRNLLEGFRQRAICHIDLLAALNRPHTYGETYLDMSHLSPNGYKAIADYLFQFLQSVVSGLRRGNTPAKYLTAYLEAIDAQILSLYRDDELDAYLQNLSQYKRNNANEVGAIVMNCNPFTNGHRYLVERALQQVDTLYIFVLQEDRSVFPYADRIRLVREGVEDLDNVMVLESGKFIISSKTMPEYFHKENGKEEKIDCTSDLLLFCKKIAPVLGITRRFAGTEPFCKITRQYNQQMQSFLPKNGITFVEIPRLAQDGVAVSATDVRQKLKAADFDAIQKLVPPSTYQYLKKWQSDKKGVFASEQGV